MFTHFEDRCQSLLTAVLSMTPKPINPTFGAGGTRSIATRLAGSPIVAISTALTRSASCEPNLPHMARCSEETRGQNR